MTTPNESAQRLRAALPKPFDTGPIPKFSADQMLSYGDQRAREAIQAAKQAEPARELSQKCWPNGMADDPQKIAAAQPLPEPADTDAIMALADAYARQSEWVGYYDVDGPICQEAKVVADAARSALRTALATRNAAAAEVVRCFRTYGMTGETMDAIKALAGGAT